MFSERLCYEGVHELGCISIFNKTDILATKVLTVPLQNYFHDFDGENSVEAYQEFIKNKFLEIRSNNVHVHFTCALDTSSIKNLFLEVKESIELGDNMKRFWGVHEVHNVASTEKFQVSA
eukprot:TRINITY_DN1400_c0_g1_i1.p2 TRINITY_DN1400_c0_g1~~TRINITY_DN1400_c0_g1_i1.p2  ORF type:complete len:120 (+),score=16.81 TRINITY_DN1400_c0_g1_i1:104-463(+)